MHTIDFTGARKHFAEEYEALMETIYLFSNPANAAQINESMKQAERGEFVEVEY